MFLPLLFNWMAYFFVALLCLVLPVIVRFFVFCEPLRKEWAFWASLINYPTIMMLQSLPYRLAIGGVSGGTPYFVASCIAGMVAAAFSMASGYVMLRVPDDGEVNVAAPIDDSTICVSELGDFINLVKKSSRRNYSLENLWQPVYSYLKNTGTIKKAISEKGATHDEIVLNAVGSMVFRLLSSERYNASPGELNPEGEYLKEIWKMAAHELVRRNYNTPDDMARGLAALYSLTASSARKGA
jgi:hypothetical protein